jgi:hypothetical protein
MEKETEMQKKYLILTIFAVLALTVVPALAQDTNWAAYLYNGNNGELVRVNPDGSQAVSALGLAPGTFIGSQDMTFTKDGGRVAFCAVTYPQAVDANSTEQPYATFYLRDIAAQNYLLTLEMGNAIGCRTGQNAFNEAEDQIAVSKINYYPGDPAADTTQPAWQILVLDVAGGMTINELNPSSLSAAPYEGLTKGGILPFVQQFTGDQMIFAEVPYGVGGGAEWNAYVWGIDADTLQLVPRWGIFSRDILASTGEMVWTTKDEALPAGTPAGPVPDNNVVKIADNSGEERTIFHSPDWVVLNAKFIDGGEQVAIQLLSSFDPNAADPGAINQTIKWIALDRAGNVTDLLSSNGNPSVLAAPDGYVALNQQITDPNNGTSQYNLTYNGGGESQELWASQDPMAYWELAWATPITPTTDLQPFPAA